MKSKGTDRRKSSGAKGGKIFSAFCSVIGITGLVIIILLCLPVTIPGFIGYGIYNVETGSMEPAMPVGSIVYVKTVSGQDIKVGDIIAFRSEGMTITHRVLENDTSAQELKTKGDANEVADPVPVRYGEVIGRVERYFPYLGTFFVFFTGFKGKMYLFGALAACVALMLIGSTVRDNQNKKKYDDEDSYEEYPGVPTVSKVLSRGDDSVVMRQGDGSMVKSAYPVEVKSGGLSKKDGILITFAIIFITLIVGSLGWVLWDMLIKKKERDAYSDIAEFVQDNTVAEKVEEPAPAPAPEPAAEEPEEVIKLNGPLEIDFEALMDVNPDVCGWIYCPDTVINYPVLKDNNNDYYLHHNYKGDYTASGSIFIECANRDDFADCNTIIYGHHMADGSMFASLSKWFKQDYYEKHPVMYIFTPEQNYVLQLFSGYTTAATSDSYWAAQTPCQEMTDYTKRVAEQSEFDPGEVELPDDGHYVMLSTCAYSFQDARSVLHGLLVPVEEWIETHEDEIDWEVKEYEPYIYVAPEEEEKSENK